MWLRSTNYHGGYSSRCRWGVCFDRVDRGSPLPRWEVLGTGVELGKTWWAFVVSGGSEVRGMAWGPVVVQFALDPDVFDVQLMVNYTV